MRLKLLTLAMALAAAPLTSHAEDLLDAYRQARANDPTLAQADAQRLGQHESVVQNRALLLPQVDASLSLNQTQSAGNRGTPEFNTDGTPVLNADGSQVVAPNTGWIRSRNQSLNVTQSVMDFSLYANLKASRSLDAAQEASYQASLQQLATRTATAYFQVLTNMDALAFAKANEQALARQLEQAQQRFDVGLSAITDVQDAKAQHDTSVASVIVAENTLADSREALTQITGQPVGELKKLREDLPMTPPAPNDPQTWVDTAMHYSPTVASAQFQVESSEASINAARAGHLPTINATAGWGRTSQWAQNGGSDLNSATGGTNNHPSTTVGVTLSIPIFSGGATQSRVRQAIYNRDASQDVLEITRRQVTRDTLNFYRSVVAGISQVEATKAAVTSSQSARDATQAGFEVGTRTIVDVLIAQQNLTQALSNYSQSRHQFVLNKLLLKQTAGEVDIKDLESVNALLQ